MQSELSVSQIRVYPVKSCGGWSLQEARVIETGFEHDREWMVVDEDGRFVTQRQCPNMALIAPALQTEKLVLNAPRMPEIAIPILTTGPKKSVDVWGDVCAAIDQGDDAAAWLTEFLGKKLRLVRMAPDFKREIKMKYKKKGDEVVGFADRLPFLIVSEASVQDLNARLGEPLPVDRFRPNIVIAGGSAFQEDGWKRIRIGAVTIRVVKQCDRCEITTVNQMTGEKGVEPLQTLGTYRAAPKGIMFGDLCVQENLGIIRINDVVNVLA